MEELWKEIKSNRYYYEVSSFGRVRRVIDKDKNIFKYPKQTAFRNHKGEKDHNYLSVNIPVDELEPLNEMCKFKRKRVHVLVAQAFIPNPDNKPTVNHKDTDKQNNHVDNLEWATAQEQTDHAIHMGINSSLKGRKLTKQQVFEILKSDLPDIELGKAYGIRPSTIYNLRTGRCYKQFYVEYVEHNQINFVHTPNKTITTDKKNQIIADYNLILEKRKQGIKAYGDVNELVKKHGISDTNLWRILKNEIVYLK